MTPSTEIFTDRRQSDVPRIRFGASSIGAPSLTLDAFCALAAQHDLDYVELRSLEGTIDLPALFEQRPPRVPTAVPVRLVASSLNLIGAKESDLAFFLKFAAIADLLQAPYIRVFGGGEWGTPITDNQYQSAAATVERCRALLARDGRQCEMLLETHSGFSASTTCLALNERLDAPLNVLWDTHHTWNLAGESPRETWSRFSPLVRHVHYGDSQANTSGKLEYVFPGHGEYPTQALFDVLHEGGYRSSVSLEWEKLWHPHLPDLPSALAAFNEQRAIWSRRVTRNV